MAPFRNLRTKLGLRKDRRQRLTEIETPTPYFGRTAETLESSPNINVFCKDNGWLFSDLRREFGEHGAEISDLPSNTADVWICVRSDELQIVPDISRTIVQVHNMFPVDIDLYNRCLGVSFTHPMQLFLWRTNGFTGNYTVCPIGSRSNIQASASLPERPTLGFFCGETRLMHKGSDLFAAAVKEARKVIDFDCLMIGRNLDHIAHLGSYEQNAAGPRDYQRIDALFTASISPGVPLSVYEACSIGKPIISTPRWFPGDGWKSIFFGESPEILAGHIVSVLQSRRELHSEAPKNSHAPYTLDGWISQNLEYARGRWASIEKANRSMEALAD
jgi:hypothetical protein